MIDVVFFAFICLLFILVSLRFILISIDAFFPKASSIEETMTVSIIMSFLAFVAVLYFHTTPFDKDIDPFVDKCYSPISYSHLPYVFILHILSIWSMIRLYSKGIHLPPIQLALNILFVTIGIIIHLHFLVQISSHDLSQIYLWRHDGNLASLIMALYPTLLIISYVNLLKNILSQKAEINKNVIYENEFLHWLNQKLCSFNNLPLASILLVIPIFIIVLIILVIFGQDVDVLNKVYTETATWRLSEHIHPPTVDDRHGHYLCTVAAHGSPNLVKPIAVGIRNNQPILVNRQLQIANAFECIIERSTPRIHSFIRRNYDHYGLNLAKRINTPKMSNLTYILMKPLEWIFLIFIYSFEKDPEKLIRRQYQSSI